MNETVPEVLIRIVRRFAPQRAAGIHLTTDTRLLDDAGIDSPRMIDILLDVEDELKITIDDGAYGNVKTFGDLVELVKGVAGDGCS